MNWFILADVAANFILAKLVRSMIYIQTAQGRMTKLQTQTQGLEC